MNLYALRHEVRTVVFYIAEMRMRSPRIQGGSLHFHKHLSFLEFLRDWEIGAEFHDLSRMTPGGRDPSVLCVGNCGHGDGYTTSSLNNPPF